MKETAGLISLHLLFILREPKSSLTLLIQPNLLIWSSKSALKTRRNKLAFNIQKFPEDLSFQNFFFLILTQLASACLGSFCRPCRSMWHSSGGSLTSFMAAVILYYCLQIFNAVTVHRVLVTKVLELQTRELAVYSGLLCFRSLQSFSTAVARPQPWSA